MELPGLSELPLTDDEQEQLTDLLHFDRPRTLLLKLIESYRAVGSTGDGLLCWNFLREAMTFCTGNLANHTLPCKTLRP